MTDDPFQLDPSAPPPTVAGLRRILAARGIDVSGVTIRTWAEKGMPGVRTEAGWTFPDPAACLAWVAANVHEAGKRTHGGKREGAGRPAGDPMGAREGLAPVIDLASELDEHRSKILAAIRAGNPAPLDLSRAGDPEYLAWLSSVGLPAKEMDRLEQGVKIQQRQVELDKLRGKLLDRDETLAAVADHAAVVRAHLEALPERLARRVVADCGLPVERAATVQAAAAELVRAVAEALSVAPLGGDEAAEAA